MGKTREAIAKIFAKECRFYKTRICGECNTASDCYSEEVEAVLALFEPTPKTGGIPDEDMVQATCETDKLRLLLTLLKDGCCPWNDINDKSRCSDPNGKHDCIYCYEQAIASIGYVKIADECSVVHKLQHYFGIGDELASEIAKAVLAEWPLKSSHEGLPADWSSRVINSGKE